MPVIMPATMLNIHLALPQPHAQKRNHGNSPESWPPKSSQWTSEDRQSVSANKVEKPGPWTPEVSWNFVKWALEQKVGVSNYLFQNSIIFHHIMPRSKFEFQNSINPCFRITIVHFINKPAVIVSIVHHTVPICNLFSY